MVLKADEVKLVRDGGPSSIGGVPKSGAKPRPIRKKGYYRAIKRGEMWAVVSYQTKKMIDDLAKQMFANTIADPNVSNDQVYIVWPWDT